MPATGQDLIARQAPIDRKMKVVDSIQLKHLIYSEEFSMPASELYDDWDNHYAHRVSALPDSFLIDLRGFCMPTTSRVLTSNFGPRWGRAHKGLDIKVYIGDTIRAAFNGKVRVVRYEAAGYGKFVVIRHDNGLETIYGHMSKQLVQPNQEVRAGDPIGLGGNTGRSRGSHLHFETRLCGIALNPCLMFDFRNQDVVDDYYMFRKSRYQRESASANRLRGVSAGANVYASTGGSAREEAPIYKPTKKTSANLTHNHKVKKGETLYSIARKHGMTVAEIQKLNHLGKKSKVVPGQILKYN